LFSIFSFLFQHFHHRFYYTTKIAKSPANAGLFRQAEGFPLRGSLQLVEIFRISSLPQHLS